MNFVPKAVTRFAGRSMLKLNANSPTILVVAGVVGFGATAVMAAKATRKIDPIIEKHQKSRSEIEQYVMTERDHQKSVLRIYASTSTDLVKLYGPTLVVGTLSTAAVLSGHKILKGRYVGAVAAYSGLFDQFKDYRARVADVIGADKEQDLYEGARLEWEEDPDHKGEYKLKSKFDENKRTAGYLMPFFDESNTNWTTNPEWNYMFLKGVQQHMNRKLEAYGHVFLNEVLEALGYERTREGVVTGWLNSGHKDSKDGYIDFGFMTSNDPNTVAFRNHAVTSVRLNFNIDGVIWDKI